MRKMFLEHIHDSSIQDVIADWFNIMQEGLLFVPQEQAEAILVITYEHSAHSDNTIDFYVSEQNRDEDEEKSIGFDKLPMFLMVTLNDTSLRKIVEYTPMENNIRKVAKIWERQPDAKHHQVLWTED